VERLIEKINLWVIIEWIATITLIVAVALTSWNIYPANIYVSLLGNFLWLLMGIHWKKWSLIIIQVFITIIYLFGLYKYFFFS
jgi:uncharacterized membrane protein